MALPAATILPGHGPVMRDWSYVQRVKGAIEQTLAGVAAAKKEGLTIKQTTERVQLPDVRDAFVAGIETRRAGYEAFFRPTLVRNAWEELDADVMNAAASATMKQVGDGVYVHGPGDGATGLTVLVNEKDVVLVNPSASPALARAAVRALRELTDKPVKYVVVTEPAAASGPGLDVFREAFTQADVVSGKPGGAGIVVGDTLTLHRGAREIRIRREAGGRLDIKW
jgi:glyoxylase-like metal-dependent hydrolase (beta-lactamase superfamily II)